MYRARRLFEPVVNNGIAVLLIATFFWAGNSVAGKFANGEISPMFLTLCRWMIAGAVLAFVARKQVRRDWPVIRKHFIYFLIMAPIGFTLFNIMLYSALIYTTALNVTIEQAAMPAFIFLINFLVFRARPLAIQLIGYTLTIIGVVLTVSGGDMERLQQFDFNIGDLIMIFAAISYAAYGVGLRAKPDMHWLSFLTVLVVIAAFMAVPFALYEIGAGQVIFPKSGLAYGIILYAAVFPSFICQACFIRGNELMGANNAALFLNATPIFGTLLSVLLLGEAFAWYHAVALVCVIGGIFIAQYLGVSGRKKAKR